MPQAKFSILDSIFISLFSLVLFSTNSLFAVTIEDKGDADSPANHTLNTFKDPMSGLSFQYPSDWEVATGEYLKSLDPPEDTVVLIVPKSLDNPSNVLITQRELPISISSDEYVELAKIALSGEKFSIGDAIQVSINSLEGSKYNITGGNIIQTHLVVVKDTTATDISYFVDPANEAKNLEDIESMINTFEIEKAETDSAEEDSLVSPNDTHLDNMDLDNAKDNAKETANKVITYAFNSFFPETGEKFTNNEHGVDITLPNNWTGIEWKAIFPLAIVSPEGINVTALFSPEISATVDSIVEEINSGGNVSELVEQNMQDLNKPVINKLLQYFTDRTSSMAIYIYDKEFARDMNSFSSNDTMPINSQASLYERHFYESTNSGCFRKSLELITLNNNIPAEKATQQCYLGLDGNRKQDNIHYFVLTPNAVVQIRYTYDPDKVNNMSLKEFEEALKTLSVKETLPINNQTIQQFLNG